VVSSIPAAAVFACRTSFCSDPRVTGLIIPQSPRTRTLLPDEVPATTVFDASIPRKSPTENAMKCRIDCLSVILATIICIAGAKNAMATPASIIHIADGKQQIGVDDCGSICELSSLCDGGNRLADGMKPISLWLIEAATDKQPISLDASKVGKPLITKLEPNKKGLRLVWNAVSLGGNRLLRVEVEVLLDEHGSRWTLNVQKPRDVQLKAIHYPRFANIRPHEEEAIAVPMWTGKLIRSPRTLFQKSETARYLWRYPAMMFTQCIADYGADGKGLFAACDDPHLYLKTFSVWQGPQKQGDF
jgi:hypothetical protein